MSEKAGGYRDLLVWQKGIVFAKEVYRLTRSFPADEKYGLVSQMRRAAVSVPSNIAEGQARRSTKEFIQFISIAEGSVAELDTQLVLAYEFGFCDRETATPIAGILEESRKILNALRRKLEEKT
ncbi:MAG: four helix bundle protein [Gemmataceae bacterium]|nr:four helix bundle protein [Gemmataceae bacterium]